MTLRRVAHKFLPTLLRPYDRKAMASGGPMCLICQHPVDSEELVEGYERDEKGNTGQYPFCRVLVKCHGAEELVRFEFDSTDWDSDDLKRAMGRHRFFDPLGHKDEDSLNVAMS